MGWLPIVCWGLFGGFFLVQWAHTLRDENRWPFVAQNMFSHELPPRARRVMVVLHDSFGKAHLAFPSSVVPVEFFRAQRLLHEALVGEPDAVVRDAFAQATLERLNGQTWPAFDEVDAAVRPSAGASFVGLDLVLYEYEVEEHRIGEPLRNLRRPIARLYTYAPRRPESAAEPPAMRRAS